jgi:hypothetical protein
MPDAATPSHSSSTESPLFSHLVSQLTVIGAQAQLIRRRIHLPGTDEAQLAVQVAAQERSLVAIEKAVALAMTQLIGASELGQMPLHPLVEADDVV